MSVHVSPNFHRNGILSFVAGFAAVLVVAITYAASPSPATLPHPATGSVLLKFDLSKSKEEKRGTLWQFVVDHTRKQAEGLGGACEVSDIGDRQLRVVFFDHQEQDAARLHRHLLGQGMLELRLLHPGQFPSVREPATSSIPSDYELMVVAFCDERSEGSKLYCLVRRSPALTDSDVMYAEPVKNSLGTYSIRVHFTAEGARKLAELTAANIGNQLGIVCDGRLCSIPAIRGQITGGVAEITGKFTQREALELANILTTPLALPATLTVE